MRYSHAPVNAIYAVSSSDSIGPTPLNTRAMDVAWLKAELGKPGRSQAALARFVGWGDPSIANKVANGKRDITADEAVKIQAYLAGTSRNDGDQVNAVNLTHPSQAPLRTPVGVRFIKRHGKVEAGAWREVFPDESLEPYPVPDIPAFSGDDLFALEVAGPSMNERYRDGTFVICRRWSGPPSPLVGKDVVIERTDASGKVETTLKELVVNERGEFELWPRSTDDRHKAPIRLDPADEREVRVIGRVTHKFEPVG